jgi:hypothetical protein
MAEAKPSILRRFLIGISNGSAGSGYGVMGLAEGTSILVRRFLKPVLVMLKS